jgi:hypothetical protein
MTLEAAVAYALSLEGDAGGHSNSTLPSYPINMLP